MASHMDMLRLYIVNWDMHFWQTMSNLFKITISRISCNLLALKARQTDDAPLWATKISKNLPYESETAWQIKAKSFFLLQKISLSSYIWFISIIHWFLWIPMRKPLTWVKLYAADFCLPGVSVYWIFNSSNQFVVSTTAKPFTIIFVHETHTSPSHHVVITYLYLNTQTNQMLVDICPGTTGYRIVSIHYPIFFPWMEEWESIYYYLISHALYCKWIKAHFIQVTKYVPKDSNLSFTAHQHCTWIWHVSNMAYYHGSLPPQNMPL